MCTLSWLYDESAYQIFFNRDELRSRRRALAPRILEIENVRVIAPTDTDGGGSWITVNEFGTSICLLNNYSAADLIERDDWISRGLLVRQLAPLQVADVISALHCRSLSRYRAFDLVVFGVATAPVHCAWSNNQLSVSTAQSPLTSSSVNTEAVITARKSRFGKLALTRSSEPGKFEAFHRSHAPTKSAYSVCMHRPDASTVSYSQVAVDQDSIEFYYLDGPPCENGASSTITLPGTLSVNTNPQVAHQGRGI